LGIVSFLQESLDHSKRDGGFRGRAGFGDNDGGDAFALQGLQEIVQAVGTQIVPGVMDGELGGIAHELNRGTDPEVRTADADRNKGIGPALDVQGEGLQFLEKFVTHAAGQLEPAEEFLAFPFRGMQFVMRLFDLGGDFRFRDPAVYQKFYKREHKAAEILQKAVYGLPEWNRADIRSASLISNPGCYPTSAILPLAPLLKEGLIRPEGIVVNSLSGVSGAGRSSSSDLSFVEVNESVKAYKVGEHQHTPEIRQTLQMISKKDVSLTFVPHLLPITRGIYTSMYAVVSGKVSEQDVVGTFDKYYKNAMFVRYSSSAIPEIKNVNFTNYIDIGFRLHPENNQLIVLSTIDNLIKGAAGQAVQNMNIMFGFEETEGLL